MLHKKYTTAYHNQKMNPFRPGNGILPPFLAGRKSFMEEFERSLKSSEKGLHSFSIQQQKFT